MIQAGSVGLATAFAAGLVSFLSPCVLPLVPAYLSYITGISVGDLRRQEEAQQDHLLLNWLAQKFSFLNGFSL